MKPKNSSINYLLIVIVMVLVAVEVYILNKHSTTGDKLTFISNKIEEIENENIAISQNIASLSSMMVIADRAKEIGLVSSPKILTLTSSYPLAANLKNSF